MNVSWTIDELKKKNNIKVKLVNNLIFVFLIHKYCNKQCEDRLIEDEKSSALNPNHSH